MKYIKSKQSGSLDEIDFGNGKRLKCNPYCNDYASFALDIGDGELIDKNNDAYFIHCEYNCDDGKWHYVFEIWFEDDTICNIDDMPESERKEYLTDAEIEGLRTIVHDLFAASSSKYIVEHNKPESAKN